MSTSTTLLFLGAFFASAVEMVEALTIVLGVGFVRGWRAPLIGVAAATVVLIGLVAVFGRALGHVPIDALRLVVGALLLAFGLQWLRKAILRSSGYKALRDEDEAFRLERDQAAGAAYEKKAGLDWYAFTVAFKGVLLEGLEVVFIVIAFGAAQGELDVAAGRRRRSAGSGRGGRRACTWSALARAGEHDQVHRGLLLTSFGCFWAAEGVGVEWPADELSLLGLLALFAVVSFALVSALRRRRLTMPAVEADA